MKCSLLFISKKRYVNLTWAPESIRPPVPPRHSGIQTALAGLLALAVAMGVGRFAFTPLLPMMQADAGLALADGGWLASANYAGYLVGALWAMAARARAGFAVRAGLIVIGLSTAAMGYEPRFAAMIALRFVAGVANAWVAIFGIAWCLQRLAPLRRPLLGGVVFAGVGAGISVVGVLCLALMEAGSGASRAWFVLGVASLIVAVGLWPVFGDGGPAERAEDRTAARAPWRRGWWGLVLAYGAAGLGYIIPATFLPVMAWREIQDPALFGLAWPVFGAAAALSTLVAALPAGADNRRVWIASQLIMAAGVALPAVVPGLAAVMVSALCVGGTFMVITMAGMQEARAAGGGHPTGLIAAATAAFALGQIAGPLLASSFAGPGSDFSGTLLFASLALALGTLGLVSPARGAANIQTVERKPS
jgi:predicted MFS family arabinose efflux permease